MSAGALTSLVLGLRAHDVSPLPIGRGDQVHGWFLRTVSAIDRDLARHLHDAARDKPFTLSDVRIETPRRPADHSEPDRQHGLVRITGLSLPVSEVLGELARSPPPTVRLGRTELAVEWSAIHPRDHEFAAFASYRELTEYVRSQAVADRIHLQVVSPAAVRAGREVLPLPLPRALFAGLAAKWNVFAPQPLHPDAVEALGAALRLSRHTIRTKAVRLHGYPQIGFIGSCEFVLDHRHDPELAALARLLAHYALFAGIGHKTTMGMGQVRPHRW